ncbi:MAG: polysaccharide biosynthesis tyrosine autokinase [Clostridiales bacterium]|nr:polysaccharide biosynthesis tyrosine autokinase [Clostridiales bacterium]
MESNSQKIDIKKLIIYLLKRLWIVIICAAIGFIGMYCYTEYYRGDTYTARATMYVINGNPNMVNYQYANASDLLSAVQLLDTYMVVVRSNKVMDVVAERLNKQYPGIPASYISSTLSMGSVSDTGVMQIICVTGNAQLSADICNAVVDVAPAEIIRVVNAGSIEVIDYAEAPYAPDLRNSGKNGLYGALAAGAFAAGILIFLFLINHRVTDMESLSDNYTPPVLAGIKRQKKNAPYPSAYLINDESPLELIESYAKLRMNLLYTMVGKENRIVAITSAVSGEGKSTIAANLAISCAMSGKKVLLVDADMRRACQKENFEYDDKCPGLSDVLVGNVHWWDAVLSTDKENLNILPAGQIPPNPAELLTLPFVKDLFPQMQQDFDLVLMDLPPINIVSDPLVISSHVAGCLLVVRQNYSDHRAIRKSLNSVELTGMNPLGFVYYGDNIEQRSYYNRKYYNKKYAYRKPDPS